MIRRSLDQLDKEAAPLASPEFTGTVVLPSTTRIGTVTNTEISYLEGVTSSIQTQLNGKSETSHTHTLDNLSDVIITTASTNNVLKFNGTNWVNSTSTGTGNVVLSTSPTLTTPVLGVATGTSFNAITGLSSTTPIVASTAAVGTGTTAARGDHVHPAQTSITGNAGTATALQTARTINGVSFNGSANINIEDRIGTEIASAATTTVGTLGLGDYIHITGTTGITSFGTAASAGVRRTLIFDAALTITHNATSLICVGATNIVTVAGTVIEIVAETTANWRVVSVTHPSVSMAELGYLDGVTSGIQTQLANKAPLASPAFTGTPTAPTAAAGTNTTQLATTAFVKAKSELDSIGVNQTWQNVTGSRVAGTAYINNTGKPIMVSIDHTNGAGNGSSMEVNSVVVSAQYSGVSIRTTFVVIVPNNSTYRNVSGGADTINSWVELR